MPSQPSSSVPPPTTIEREAIHRYADKVLAVRRLSWRHDLVIVSAAGEVDVVSVRLLQRALWQDLPECVVVDLTEVTFFGSAGVQALERTVARAQAEHRRIGIVASTRSVNHLLRITGLDTLVGVYQTLADAVREVPLSAPPAA